MSASSLCLIRISPRRQVAIGLLLVSVGMALRSLAPTTFHSDLGELAMGLLTGVGIAVEFMALVRMRRAR